MSLKIVDIGDVIYLLICDETDIIIFYRNCFCGHNNDGKIVDYYYIFQGFKCANVG
jgi:hypothetical protein